MTNHRIESLIENFSLGGILAAQGITPGDRPNDIVGDVVLEKGRRVAVFKGSEGILHSLDREHCFLFAAGIEVGDGASGVGEEGKLLGYINPPHENVGPAIGGTIDSGGGHEL